MPLESNSLSLLSESVRALDQGFRDLPQHTVEYDLQAMREVMLDVARRMQDNFPYPHPLYAGQMLKPPHPIARLAYALSMWINPNNHALDGGRASSAMEKEAVAEIAAMVGWRDCLGHLCGGGTMANLEALWVGARLHPGSKIVASDQAHYTHGRISEVLQLDFESVASDSRARMDLQALESLLQRTEVGTVVATLGTTGTGSVDPLTGILALKEKHGFRLHVDAAYGGYFRLVDDLDTETRAAFAAMEHADSIVIDPHKHGLQPYGCGCVLFRDPGVGGIYKHDSPYTYFSSDELHLGEISLECSRAGASAVALWATMRLLPLLPGGEFAEGLARGHRAATALYARLQDDPRYLTLFEPELDILVWAPAGARSSDISRRSSRHFDEAAKANLHLALIQIPTELAAHHWPDVDFDEDTLTCLRSCLMKPEHLDWLDDIWTVLDHLVEND